MVVSPTSGSVKTVSGPEMQAMEHTCDGEEGYEPRGKFSVNMEDKSPREGGVLKIKTLKLENSRL